VGVSRATSAIIAGNRARVTTAQFHVLATCVPLKTRHRQSELSVEAAAVGGLVAMGCHFPGYCDMLSPVDRARRSGDEAMAKVAHQHASLLPGLPLDLKAGLFAKARTKSLGPDQTLFLTGDPSDGCYLLDEGLLKVTVIARTGGERILAILGPGEMVGELSMMDGTTRSASVTALRDSKLSFISRAAFEAFANVHPEIYRHCMILLARRLRYTNDALAATSFISLKGRVARTLLNLAEAFGHDVGSGRILVHQKVTQSDLAAMAGIARENVNRILNDWTRCSIVSRLSGYYCVESKAALQREAEA
jgi:CRP/FNR family cyclic AMP-dependent transcriptional regulator